MGVLSSSYDFAVRSLRQARHALTGRREHRRFLERRYYQLQGRWPNLDDPRLFSEKLLWLNVYHRHPLMPPLTDKYLAREVVARRVGSHILGELLGVWDDAREIPFDQLPNEFVLKVTAGSTWNIFCRDKGALDVPQTIAQLQTWCGQSYYDKYREWPYEGLQSRIIAEPFRCDPAHPQRSTPDYKFFCFDGHPAFVSVCNDRRGLRRIDCYDRDWKIPAFRFKGAPPSDHPLSRPDNYDEMLDIAARLSHGFPFVRVDLYNHQGKILFGEMTWFPSAGYVIVQPEDMDPRVGAMIKLPGVSRALSA